jgi:hypothetical protein
MECFALMREIFDTCNHAKVLVEPSDDSATLCSPTVRSVTNPRPRRPRQVGGFAPLRCENPPTWQLLIPNITLGINVGGRSMRRQQSRVGVVCPSPIIQATASTFPVSNCRSQ